MCNEYEVIGVGFGPSNIGLAIQLAEESIDYRSLFLDRSQSSVWHSGMLLRNADIQNHPLRDLITLVNPRSHFSFINYLHQENRLSHFLNTGLYYPMRQDYANYIQWCAGHFDNLVVYNNPVQKILLSDSGDTLEICTERKKYITRSVVIASGRERNVPGVFHNIQGPRCFHACDYLDKVMNLDVNKDYRFVVVGASQSAAEIILDLYSRFPNAKINSVIRNYSFKMKDKSPFSYEIYFPESIDFFYQLSLEHRGHLGSEMRRTNYSSVDQDVLDELYKVIYMQRVYGKPRIEVDRNIIIDNVELSKNVGFVMSMHNKYSQENKSLNADVIIFATGFEDAGKEGATLPLLENIRHKYQHNPDGSIKVNRDYSLEALTPSLPKVYLSGLCEASHGLGDAGSFSLIPIRCKTILSSLQQHLEKN